MALEQILSLDNPSFSCYLFYVSLLIVKLLCMSNLTGLQRIRKQVKCYQQNIFLFDNL